eukprot:1181253-Prorocentrum_minimum.AAC.5
MSMNASGKNPEVTPWVDGLQVVVMVTLHLLLSYRVLWQRAACATFYSLLSTSACPQPPSSHSPPSYDPPTEPRHAQIHRTVSKLIKRAGDFTERRETARAQTSHERATNPLTRTRACVVVVSELCEFASNSRKYDALPVCKYSA